MIKVGKAIWGAAQPAKVCGQALHSAHGIRRIAAGGAAFPKVEGLLAQPCTNCILKQELHNRTCGLCCMIFWAVPPKSPFGTLLRCSRADTVTLTSQGTVPYVCTCSSASDERAHKTSSAVPTWESMVILRARNW